MNAMLSKKLPFFPAIAIRVASLFFSLSNKKDMPHKPSSDRVSLVETFPMMPAFIAPVTEGYGIAQPKGNWSALSEVPRKIAYIDPKLEHGSFIPSGTEVIKLDDADYQLALLLSKSSLESA